MDEKEMFLWMKTPILWDSSASIAFVCLELFRHSLG